MVMIFHNWTYGAYGLILIEAQHFAKGDAWKVADGAVDALEHLRTAGVKLAVVSNFDSRLRPVLQDLQVYTL
jgi:FMN phosphatase YigB (HAD superfamily)